MMMPSAGHIAHSGYTGSVTRQFGAKGQETDHKDQARKPQTDQDQSGFPKLLIHA
ncbi:hypothetical protein [Aquabacterium sp.]|uniref:hypothetical protein n=1 Tax=Aquabacterium sp. TaxID=1872578 RepID=UPI0040376F88